MTFFVNGQTTAKVPIDDSGTAVFTTNSLIGSPTIVASYDGDVPTYSASAAAPLTITITAAP